MVNSLKDLVVKPMVTGIAAGIFPTLIVLYGVNQSINDVKVREQLLEKKHDNHAELLKEKVELVNDIAVLQENYALLIEENRRLSKQVDTGV